MSDIRKRNGRKGATYQVRYADPFSRTGYSYKTFKTAKEARAFRPEPTPSLPSGQQSVPESIDFWLHVCEREGRDGRAPVSSGTAKHYRHYAGIMKRYPWDKPVAGLTKPDIVAFRSWLIAEHGRYVAGKALTYFHGVLAEMATRGVVSTNACIGVGVRKETRYDDPVVIPTHEEVKALLQAADELAKSRNKQTAKAWARYRPMLYLAVDSGMRPQEYVAIAGANLRDGGIHVERAIDSDGALSVTKTPASRRFIELSPETFDMVTHYRDKVARENDFDLVFPTDAGTWQSLKNWRNRGFYEACAQAGLIDKSLVEGEEVETPRYPPYALRHYFASVLIASGTDIAKIKTLMGHTDITTTYSVYAHLIRQNEQARSQRTGLISTIRQ